MPRLIETSLLALGSSGSSSLLLPDENDASASSYLPLKSGGVWPRSRTSSACPPRSSLLLAAFAIALARALAIALAALPIAWCWRGRVTSWGLGGGGRRIRRLGQ